MYTFLVTAKAAAPGFPAELIHRLFTAKDQEDAERRANEQLDIANKAVPEITSEIESVKRYDEDLESERGLCGFLLRGRTCEGHIIANAN